MMMKRTGACAVFLSMALWSTAVVAQDVQTKQYDDGGIYEGSFRNGLQHGQGTYTLPNGFEYSGEWVDGEMRGQGTARYPNGSIYVGAFAKGKPEGFGKITTCFPELGLSFEKYAIIPFEPCSPAISSLNVLYFFRHSALLPLSISSKPFFSTINLNLFFTTLISILSLLVDL